MINRRDILVLIVFMAITVLIYSCANRGYPKGGPKDVAKPFIVKEDPVNGGTDFNKKKLNIYFNEFVQLKDVASKFMISPPQKKKPKVKLRGMRVLVEFQDTLRDNTTYSLDFGTSIVDNNEGNPMGEYRYFFSTGNHIDTMKVGGNVFDAFTHKPVENAYVMLYDEHITDSIPLLEVPLYVARTDTAGYFNISNIKQQRYRIMAIEDGDRNYIFTSPTERVAFSDSIIYPVSFPMEKRDTSSQDSTLMIPYVAFGPANIHLDMFQEKPSQQYLLDAERKERGSIDFNFAIPRKDSLKIDLFGIDNEDEVFLKELNPTMDTLKYWIVDTTVFNLDTIKAELRYLKTDTLGKLVEYRDTTDFNFEDDEVYVDEKENNKKKKKGDKPKIDFLKIKFNLTSSVNIDSKLSFKVEEPVLGSLDSLISLYKLENDTVKLKQKIKINRDSLRIRNYSIDYKWIPEAKYSLELDSASVFSVFGKFNDKIVSKLKVKSVEEYGTIKLTLKNGKYPMILSLATKSGQDYKPGRSIYPTKDGVYTLKHVIPGKYFLMAIFDTNGNRVWDTGNYLKHIFPERVEYLDKEMDIRENWDFEEKWDFLDFHIKD